MFCAKVSRFFLRIYLSRNSWMLPEPLCSQFLIMPGPSRHFSVSTVQGLEKKVDNRVTTDFEKIAQDLDKKLNEDDDDEKEVKRLRKHQTFVDERRRRYKRIFLLLVIGLTGFAVAEYYFILRPANRAIGQKQASIGRPQIGAPWRLINMKGDSEGSEELKGNWLLLYFGFTHCPDVCPDELEKMIRIVDRMDSAKGEKISLIPVFISVDPERDTPKRVADYCAEFSPKLKGYTGTAEQVAEVAKKFRVYYKAGPRTANAPDDYIVDHSIMVYLIDPDGNFVDFYGQNRDENEVVEMIKSKVIEYDAKNSKTMFWFFKQ